MELSYEVVGPQDAPEIVLIHGITENRHAWRPIIDRLAERYRVLAVDLRGHGESPSGDAYDPASYASDVVETIQAVAFRSPLLVGHSLGGVVASAVASLTPSRGVINVDQPLRLAGFKVGLTQLQPLLEGTVEQFELAMSMLFESMYGALSDDERDRIRALRQPDQAVVLGTWATVFNLSEAELDRTVGAMVAGIKVPYLSIHGIDPGPGYADWLTEMVPGAALEFWEDLGHYPHLIESDRLCAQIDRFR